MAGASTRCVPTTSSNHQSRYTRNDTERIALYRPRIEPHIWAQIAPFVRSVVSDTLSSTTYETYKLLGVTTAHCRFVWRAGLPIEDRAVVFAPSMVERFIVEGCTDKAPATRNAARVILYRVGEHAAGVDYSEFFERRATEHVDRLAPYSPTEVVSLRNLFRGRRRLTPIQRTATLAIPIVAGGGLTRDDLIRLRCENIRRVDDDYLVTIPSGPRARTVPILHDWVDVLDRALDGSPTSGPLLGVEGRTVAASQLRRLTQTSNLEVHVSLRRLRTTWLVQHLTIGTPITVLLAAAGLTTIDTVASLMEHVAPIDDADARRFLTGRRP